MPVPGVRAVSGTSGASVVSVVVVDRLADRGGDGIVGSEEQAVTKARRTTASRRPRRAIPAWREGTGLGGEGTIVI